MKLLNGRSYKDGGDSADVSNISQICFEKRTEETYRCL